DAIGIAPEGTRSKTGKLIEAKEGAAYIALKSEAWIVPMAIWGQENAIREWKQLRRPHVFVRVGEPFKLEQDPEKNRQENLEVGTRRIIHAIARLLPEEYRGYYADEVLGPPEW
ncbi:MAG: 1-acyl-sn-glycerol-3-phosphate acyltransferase, partial [Chloroflexota bacterium]|nr:1-acyl-sn-glycerol-3-phosphate acyltransferase [Chloroflexota bacterium]